MESTQASQPTPSARYAGFTRRFRALLIDNLCVAGVVLALFFLGDAVSDIPGASRVIWLLMVATVLLYDPLLVSRRGATIGHAASRLRVVDARTGRWPSFGRAFARSLVKQVLGLLSFFTMELTRRHQAVHDMLTHTTVQMADSEETAEFRVERVDEADVVLPSRFRRVAVILAYLVAIFLGYAVSVTLADTTGCLRGRAACGAGTEILVDVAAWVWLGLSVAVVIAGWKGLLLGARRSKRVSVDVAVA